MNREHFDSCTSTMDLARHAIDQPQIVDCIPTVVTADKQTKGEGQNGNIWWSPEGMGLYASFIVPEPKHDTANGLLTSYIGHAVVSALRAHTHLNIYQMGINDIYLDQRKLGGMLCEIYKGYLIIGIGLNVFRPSKVRKDLLKTAVWLNEFGAEHLLGRAQLIDVLSKRLI